MTSEQFAELERKLDRMDGRSSHGAWTRKTLRLIADHPAVVSTELAKEMGMERFAFKAEVRKLKRLGLTESLEVGYRLSALGREYLERAKG